MRVSYKIIPRIYNCRPVSKIHFNLQQTACAGGTHRCTKDFLNPKPFDVQFLQKASVVDSASKEPPTYNPEEGHLVYVGPLTKFVKCVKVISVSTSVMGLVVQPFIYKSLLALPAILQAFVGGSLGLFIFANPFVFHWVAKRYITTLYYKTETEVFTANTFNFFAMKKSRKFKAEDVHIPDIAGIFTTFTVSGVPLFLAPQMFLQPNIYKKLMGFDKPIDLSDFINDKSKEKE